MDDPALNRRLEETRELHTRWSQFHDFFTMALKGENVSPEAEMRFLDLKTRICMLHDGFMQSLKHDQKVGQQVLGILGQCILLRRISLLSSAEVQKLELDWNEAYMLMNETIAALDEERRKLANINESAYKIQKARQLMMARIHNVLTNTMFRVAFFIIVIPVFVIVGVPWMGIYDYRNLKTDFPTAAPMVKKFEDFWRAKINPELEYSNLADVPVTAVESGEHKDDPQSLRNFNKGLVISQLFNMGFGKNDMVPAKAMVDGLIEIAADARIMIHGGRKKMLGYIMLFKTTSEAKAFLDLRNSGMASKSDADRKKINALVNVCRKANLVVFIISEEPKLRDEYPKLKWGFADDQVNQAQGAAAP